MGSFLCITIRFLLPSATFHGRADGNEAEWPPSPLRLFQALVDAASNRWRGSTFNDVVRPALTWLQNQSIVKIVAPRTCVGASTRIAVPNNDLDIWAEAVAKGRDPKKQPAELKTMKVVRPTHLQTEAVHYVFQTAEQPVPIDTIRMTARGITHLGWGIDTVIGDAVILSAEELDQLEGVAWYPRHDGIPLRVPVDGTLDALATRHHAFLNRITDRGFKPVPPLSKFQLLGFGRAIDPVARPFAAFGILKPDASGNRSFDTVRRCREVAAWIRGLTGEICMEWPFGTTLDFVHGHDSDGKPLKGNKADDRFMYLPLPSIERRGDLGQRVGSIRRVLITAPPQFRERIDWIRRRLLGQELTTLDGEIMGLLNILPANDWVLSQYTRPSRTWSTVTPVVWPGHDDRDSKKSEAILRRAFEHSGLAKELVDQIEELTWRPVGFRAGVELASRYVRPDNMKGRVYHVRVRFPNPIPGPLVVGAGRYRGFGLFAAED